MKFLNNKVVRIFLKILVVIVLFIVVGLVWNKLHCVPDNIKFSKEYTSVDEDNIYVYASKTNILDAFASDKAVVFLGFPECIWCQEYAKQLNEIAKNYGVDKILYYNVYEDRENNSEFYIQLTSMLKDYLYTDEEGESRIYVPDVYFIKNGEIIGHNNDTSTISDMQLEDYYTDENTKELQQKLQRLLTVYSNCDDKKGC